jgi:hypothetical protein
VPRLRTCIRRTLTAALVATTTLATPALGAPAQGQAIHPHEPDQLELLLRHAVRGHAVRHAAGPGRLRPPRVGSLTLAPVRRPADDQAHRQGTLLLNDGAGGSPIEPG